MANELTTLMRKMGAILSAYRRAHGLPLDYDLRTLPAVAQIVTIDEFLCQVCDAFIGDAGCADHPVQRALL